MSDLVREQQDALVQIPVLVTFVLLMLLLNLKAGRSHWTSSLLKTASFWLMAAVLVLLTWRVAGVVL